MKNNIKKINLLTLGCLIPTISFSAVSCSNEKTNPQENENIAPVGIEQKTWEKWRKWTEAIEPNKIGLDNKFVVSENLIKNIFSESLNNPETNNVFDWKKDDTIRWNFQKLLGLETGVLTKKPDLEKVDLNNLKDLMTLWFNYNNLSWFQNWQNVNGGNRNRQSKGYRKNFSQIDNLKLIDLSLPENVVIQPFINEGKISFDLTISNSCGFTLSDGFKSNGDRVILTEAYFNSWIKFKVETTITFNNFDDQGKLGLDLIGIGLDGTLEYVDGDLDFEIKDNDYLIKESKFIDSSEKYVQFLRYEAEAYLNNFKNVINEKKKIDFKNVNLTNELDYDFVQNVSADGKRLPDAHSIDDNSIQEALNEHTKENFLIEWKLDLLNNLLVQTPFGKWDYERFEVENGWNLYIPMIIPVLENGKLKFKVWDYI